MWIMYFLSNNHLWELLHVQHHQQQQKKNQLFFFTLHYCIWKHNSNWQQSFLWQQAYHTICTYPRKKSQNVEISKLKPDWDRPAAAAASHSPPSDSVDSPSLQLPLWVAELSTVPELHSLCLSSLLLVQTALILVGWLEALTHNPTLLLLDSQDSCRTDIHHQSTDHCWSFI